MENIKNQVATRITYLKPNEKVCPVCGSANIQGISRVTGYLSLDERFGDGKSAERSLRKDHNSAHKANYSCVCKK